MIPYSNYALDANTTFKYARSGPFSLHENSTETGRFSPHLYTIGCV